MIDPDLALQWIKDYFGETDILFSKQGEEICVPSPFAKDRPGNHYLWINPTGGKSLHPENGVYRCWYTDKSGSMVSLVSQLEGIPWDEAQEMLCDQIPLRELELRVHEFFGSKIETNIVPQTNVGKIHLPPHTYEIDRMEDNLYRQRATTYLNGRKIPTDGLLVCVNGKCRDRIVIPYYDKNGNLIWWNARAIDDNAKIRYIKPDTDDEDAITQQNVLYLKTWPKKNEKVFVMEGELDAITINLCGFYGAACGGRSLSDGQIELLRDYVPVLAFDSDTPGKMALINIGHQLLEKGFPAVYFVRPPCRDHRKDWNAFLKDFDIPTIQQYIQRRLKTFNNWTADQLKMATL